MQEIKPFFLFNTKRLAHFIEKAARRLQSTEPSKQEQSQCHSHLQELAIRAAEAAEVLAETTTVSSRLNSVRLEEAQLHMYKRERIGLI